jgi:hypothetical protein
MTKNFMSMSMSMSILLFARYYLALVDAGKTRFANALDSFHNINNIIMSHYKNLVSILTNRTPPQIRLFD